MSKFPPMWKINKTIFTQLLITAIQVTKFAYKSEQFRQASGLDRAATTTE